MVCGRARRYQKGETPSFFSHHQDDETIDGNYAYGLLITYDSPQQYIWTCTKGYYDNRTATCCTYPCVVGGGPSPPPFVD